MEKESPGPQKVRFRDMSPVTDEQACDNDAQNGLHVNTANEASLYSKKSDFISLPDPGSDTLSGSSTGSMQGQMAFPSSSDPMSNPNHPRFFQNGALPSTGMEHPFMSINQLLNPTPRPQYYQAPMQYGWLPAASPPATEESVSPAVYRTPMNPPGFKAFASASNHPTYYQPTEYELPRKRVKPNTALPIRGKNTSTPKHGIPHESKYNHASGQTSTPRSQRPKPNLVVEFTDVAAHTAKCDQCNGRNKDGMTRCATCGWQCCRKCLNNRHGDRTHPSFTSTHVPANESGLSSFNRRNTANVSASASASGSGSASATFASAAATTLNTPCPVRNEASNQNSPSVSSIFQSSNSPTPAQRSGFTISSAPAQRSGLNTGPPTTTVQRSGFTAFSSIITSPCPAPSAPTRAPVSDREPAASRPSAAGATPEAKAAILLMDLSSDSSLSSTGVVEGAGPATQEHGGGGAITDNQDGVQWSADDFDFPVGEEYDNVRRNPSRRARPIDMKE
ncbi:hypothetical protein N7493_005115 [Penicillium malachiteum]|uniref:Uncharacterized protein n=1 Tax=Penicillium malachiteum TaxID=1324776 RepID=A0AAD6HMG4_9EURO|nr:hypothetical protein N7493_005115 [Penicillium malachiteum]